MKILTSKDIASIYEKLVTEAVCAYSKCHLYKTYKFIKAAAKWAYGFNYIFVDRRLEKLIHSLSEEIIPSKRKTKDLGERFVLIDTCGEDNRGLHQQYLRAFEYVGVSYLFVTLRKDISPLKRTIEEILSYNKGSFWHYEGEIQSPYKIAQILSDILFDYSPNRIFLHLMPSDIITLLAVDSIIGPKKYNINLTDHAFWLGATFVDYNIEFRGCGRTISLEKRGFKEYQLINLPFYPVIQNNNIRDDLPQRDKGDIVVFTGGSPYKMLGKDGFFFKVIIEKILSLSPNVKVWVAGFNLGDTVFENTLNKMNNRDRVFNIGVRRDINHVFEQCDIYLGTYPVGGGLMTQYAAINGKPILSFSDTSTPIVFNIDDIVNQCSKSMETFVCIEDLISYARKLILDANYRKQEGFNNKSAIMSMEKFNDSFYNAIMNKRSNIIWKEKIVDYEAIAKLYLDIENEEFHYNFWELISVLRLSALTMLWKYYDIVLPIFWKSAKKYSFNLKKLKY